MDIGEFVVGMLNALSRGVSSGAVSDLLLSPDQYNAGMYAAAVQLHNVAVKPVTAVVLSIVAVLSIASGASRLDQGDQQMGIRMIAGAMFRVAMVLVATEASLQILRAIDQVVVLISSQANGLNVGGTAQAQPLGDVMEGQIKEAGITEQMVMIVVLLLPWIVSAVVSVLATVLVFVRFLQLYVMTAFASLPIAFFGMESTKGIGMGYVKRYATTAFQGAVLIISLKLYQALMGGWLSHGLKIDEGTDVFGLVTNNMGQFFVAPFVLAFILFGSTALARAIVGEG